MGHLTALDLAILFVSLGLMLGVARIGGEIAQRWNQPAVLGEIIAGILLGPTVLGTLFPDLGQALFPKSGVIAIARDGLVSLAIVLFVLVAGMEVDLSRVWKQGRAAVTVSVAGIVLPFSVGLAAGRLFPITFGRHADADPLVFTLFLGVALSISALPVIAKTLMDLKIYRSDLGMVVISAAIFDDLTGWTIFALVLGMMEAPGAHHGNGFFTLACMTIGFATLMLTVVRWCINRSLPWIQAHTTWPGGVLGFAFTLAFFSAACTEWIGVHAIFGSFLMGIAIGDSTHLREQTRTTISQFIAFSFAPIFFASIGLRVNFYEHFDPVLTGFVLLIACVGKILGCSLGARLGGLAPREAWAIGFAMNARGAMEIILGVIALQNDLIDERMFVALVVMAIVTSLMSGPAMSAILRLRRARRLSNFVNAKAFIQNLRPVDRETAIRELVAVTVPSTGLPPEQIEAAVLQREALMPTGIGDGVAIPHARVDGLKTPVIGVAMSATGVDFNAPDGQPARLIILILTPTDDGRAQIELLADVASTFGREQIRSRALNVSSFTEFLALLRTEQVERLEH